MNPDSFASSLVFDIPARGKAEASEAMAAARRKSLHELRSYAEIEGDPLSGIAVNSTSMIQTRIDGMVAGRRWQAFCDIAHHVGFAVLFSGLLGSFVLIGFLSVAPYGLLKAAVFWVTAALLAPVVWFLMVREAIKVVKEHMNGLLRWQVDTLAYQASQAWAVGERGIHVWGRSRTGDAKPAVTVWYDSIGDIRDITHEDGTVGAAIVDRSGMSYFALSAIDQESRRILETARGQIEAARADGSRT